MTDKLKSSVRMICIANMISKTTSKAQDKLAFEGETQSTDLNQTGGEVFK